MMSSNFGALLKTRAQDDAHRLAYRFVHDGDTGEETLTYGALYGRAAGIARAVLAARATTGPVMLLYGPGLDYVAAFLGCLMAGVIAVPAPPPTSRRHLTRLAAIADDIEPALILTTHALGPKLARFFADVPTLARVRRVATDRLEADNGHAPEPAPTQTPPRQRRSAISFAQQQLWLRRQIDPRSSTYHAMLPVRVKGALDREALGAALDVVVQRHERLRTSVQIESGQLVPVIHADCHVPIAYVDLEHAADGELWARDLAEAAVRQPFDLTNAPLMRVTLMRLDDAHHVLVVVVPHLASDPWPVSSVATELMQAYEAALDGRPPEPSDRMRPQADRIDPASLAPQIEYWRRQLADAPARMNLPVAHGRSASAPAAGTHTFTIPHALTRRIERLGRRERATPFMVLLSALAALMRYTCNEDDLVIGSPCVGRAGRDGTIDAFGRALPLRLRPSGAATFEALLCEAREVTLDAGANQDVSFARLVEELRPPPEPGSHPIFQVLLTYRQASRVSGPTRLRVEPFEPFLPTATFDLVLNVSKQHGALSAGVEYAADIFDAETVARMFDDYLTLLDVFCADPGTTLDEVDLRSPSERRLLLQPVANRESGEPVLLRD
jgi:hypothetical protein